MEDPQGFQENREVARRGGSVAGNARREIEAQTGRPVITSQNAAQLNATLTGMIEEVADSISGDSVSNDSESVAVDERE